MIEELEFTTLAFGGNAVARRPSGKVCFVPGAIPGERAEVEVTDEKKNYSYGTLVKLLAPSPRRIRNVCPNPCPGCPYAHLDYALELEWKERQFAFFASRLKDTGIGGILPAAGAETRLGWRNKIRLSLESPGTPSLRAGYRAEDNRSLVEAAHCPIAASAIDSLLADGAWKAELRPPDTSVTFRATERDGALFFTDRTPYRMLTESLGKYGKFEVGLRSFFQINPPMAVRLVDRFLETAAECSFTNLVELHCGCGVFSIAAAERFGVPATGVELDPAAVRAAAGNAARHGTGALCSFHTGDAGRTLARLFRSGKTPSGTLLAVDPPRTGLDPAALDAIVKAAPDHIIYISCGPASLMRDLERFARAGFRAERSGLLDLFPSTAHFETLTLLNRP